MSNTTRNINKVTGTVIGLAIRVIVIAIVMLILVRGVKVAYNFGHAIFYETTMEEAPGTDIRITIPADCSIQEAADILESKGLIDNKLALRVQAKAFELEVKPGTYTLNTSTSARKMLEILNAGPKEESNAQE